MKGCPKCGRRYTQDEEFCSDDGETLVDLADVEKDPLVGSTLDGRYLIQKRLGEGGMGLVYSATHAVIGKRCAIKVLRSEVSAESDMAERFIQEARSAAAIDNPHVIEITDFGQTPDGNAYFVMEYLDGRSLQTALREDGRFNIARAFHIAEQCCEALEAAHSAGVVHRDLKPENLILIQRDKDNDYVKVLDFGIAKVVRETGRLTRTGTIFGTPQYMAPEQAAGTAMDLRVDIYSLGIIIYEMLCGRVPFEADTFMGVLTKHLYEQPLPPSQVLQEGLPRAAESIILKALSKKPERRYPTMASMQDDLRAVLEGRTPEAELEEIANSTMPPPPSEVVGVSSRRRQKSENEAPESKAKRPVFFGIGIFIVAAVFSVGWFVTRNGEEKAPPTQATSSSPGVASTVDAPPFRALTLHSKPEGARVYFQNAFIGNTPTKVSRPISPSEHVTFRLSLEGYRDLEVLVSQATPEDFTPELMPVPSPTSSTATSDTATDAVLEAAKSKKLDKSRNSDPKKKKKKDGKLGGDIVDPWGNK